MRERIGPEKFGLAYPDRIASRYVRDAFPGDGLATILIDEQAGGGEAGVDTQPLARLVQMRIDGMFGYPQFAGDLLGAEMFVHQPQALTFALS